MSALAAATCPAERTLAVALLGFAAVLDEVAETLQFHRLCGTCTS